MTYSTANQEVPSSSWDICHSSMYDLNLPEAINDTELHPAFHNNNNNDSFDIKIEDTYSPMTNAYQVSFVVVVFFIRLSFLCFCFFRGF